MNDSANAGVIWKARDLEACSCRVVQPQHVATKVRRDHAVMCNNLAGLPQAGGSFASFTGSMSSRAMHAVNALRSTFHVRLGRFYVITQTDAQMLANQHHARMARASRILHRKM